VHTVRTVGLLWSNRASRLKIKASSGVRNKQLNVDPAVSMFEANSDRDRDVTKAHAHWQGDTLG